MMAPVTLSLYGVGLVAVFAASFAIGSAVIPDDLAEAWTEQAQHADHPETPDHPEGMTKP